MLYYFLLVISIWRRFKLRFILKSRPENHNALGSALVDSLCQERPRLKYGSFSFLLLWRSHSLWRIATQKRRRGSILTERHLFVLWMILSMILQTKPSYISSEKPNLKKMYTQAAHIISQQTLLSACTPSLYPSCALLSVYIEPVSDELFYMRFKIFKNKKKSICKESCMGKKTDLSMLILSIWV